MPERLGHDNPGGRSMAVFSRTGRWALRVLPIAVAAFTLTACGSSSSPSPQAKGSSASGSSTDGYAKKLSVLFISGAAPGDVFWGSVQKGAEQAAADEDASLEYLSISSQSDAETEEAQQFQAAIVKHPDAIVVANEYPSALDPLIKQAEAAGITVVVANAGQASWKSDGAIAYVGQSDYQAGVEAGQQMAAAGIKVAICENVPGYAVSMDRCGGFAKGFDGAGGKAINVDFELAQIGSPTYLERALEAILTANKNAQAIMATGVIGWTPAIAALKQLGDTGTVKLATFDLSTGDLQATADGTNLFLVDQQPYLEGYDSVQTALQYLRYGLVPVDGTIATGPDIITEANAAAVLKYNSLGVRGAS
jgi:simple sugar transport system substrate-binding protein